jgi:hypothetical protein
MRRYRVTRHVSLRGCDPRDTGRYKTREAAARRTEHLRQRLDALQERLDARLLARLDDPAKRWKFSSQDLLDWKKLRRHLSEA